MYIDKDKLDEIDKKLKSMEYPFLEKDLIKIAAMYSVVFMPPLIPGKIVSTTPINKLIKYYKY